MFLSDLCVSHAGSSYQSLLQCFILQSIVRLSGPLQLQQILDYLEMASERGVHQSTLSALIHMINLAQTEHCSSKQTQKPLKNLEDCRETAAHLGPPLT